MSKKKTFNVEKRIIIFFLCISFGLSVFTTFAYADGEEDEAVNYDYINLNTAYFDYQNWDGWHKNQVNVLYENMKNVQDISEYSNSYAIDYLVSTDFSGLSIDSIDTPALTNEEKTIIKEYLMDSTSPAGLQLNTYSISVEEILPVVLGSVSYIKYRGESAFLDMVDKGIFEDSGNGDALRRYTYAVVKKICIVSSSFKRWSINVSREETGEYAMYSLNLHNAEDLTMFIMLVFHDDIPSALSYLPTYEVRVVEGNTSIYYHLNDAATIEELTGISSYYTQSEETVYTCSAMYYILGEKSYVVQNQDSLIGTGGLDINYPEYVTASTTEAMICNYRNITDVQVVPIIIINNTGSEEFPEDEHTADEVNNRPGLIIGNWAITSNETETEE